MKRQQLLAQIKEQFPIPSFKELLLTLEALNYDPSKETITEVQITGKKASIFTDRVYARMNYKREYKYKLVEGHWLLDTIKEQYLPENKDPEKWKSVII